MNENKINVWKIVQAGKAIKAIFTAALSLIIFFAFCMLVVTNSTDVNTIKNIYMLCGFLSLLLNIVILYNLYEAGDNLVNVNLLPEGVANDNSIIAELNVNNSRTVEFAEGGIIVNTDQNGEHGLVCSKIDLGKIQWDLANTHCEEYENEGFTDWRLPNDDELNLIYSLLQSNQLGSFHKDYYWSSSLVGNKIVVKNFANGDSVLYGKKNECNFCCVRSF